MKELLATVVGNRIIAENTYSIRLALPEDVGEIRAGQFANLSAGSGELLLKRPLGIERADEGDVTLCYKVRGEGTRRISRMKEGDRVSVLLPLGNGFDVRPTDRKIAVIGGGAGIFPLISVINAYPDRDFYTYFGFKDRASACLLDEAAASRELTVLTDDGSLGERGNAVDMFLRDGIDADLVVSCGPAAMFRALKAKMSERGMGTRCLVSLEERMACGIGACLGCACRMADGTVKRVCRDGPVFDITEVEL